MTGSGETHHLVQRGRLSGQEVFRRERIAAANGATFVYVTLPGTGPQSWFSARSKGHPHDDALARRLEAAVTSRVPACRRYTVRVRAGAAWTASGRLSVARRAAREAAGRGLANIVIYDEWTGHVESLTSTPAVEPDEVAS